MSAKSAVIVFRSPAASAALAETGETMTAGALAGGASAADESRAPHWVQNFEPGGFFAPHEGQDASRRVPHSAQNFAVAALSVLQFGQFIGNSWGR
jgi:hypothetical protein